MQAPGGGGVGFDIAGARRAGRRAAIWTPSSTSTRKNFHITIHAGEGFGLPSIWEAVQYAGTERLGHGVRITEDISDPRRRRRGLSAAWRATSATGASA